MRKPLLAALAGSSIATIAIVTPAIAQNAQAQASDEGDDEAIVVTGTQIRGIAPVGSNVIGMSQEQIKATGVNDANQLLAQLPQSNYFLSLPEPGGGAIGAGTLRVPLSKPNLRNLPVGQAGTGQITLVLMDGHRIVPAGIEQSVVDAGIVPPSLLERSEIILDGASAVYGSDAVGGVINYITRKRYDGAQISGRYGFADDYWQADVSATIGKTWDTGGISISYEFAKNTSLLNKDRDYNAPINWLTALSPITGTPTGTSTVPAGPPAIDDLTCDVPNVQNGSGGTPTNTFHVSGAGLVPNPLFCSSNDFTTQTPSQRRHSVFAVLSQDFGDSIKFDVTGMYTDRFQSQNSGPYRAGLLIRPNNPFYRCNTALTGTCTGTTASTQRVNFSYGPLFGNDTAFANTTTKIWQITPSLTVELGSEWQVRGSFAYGRSKVSVDQHVIDTTTQTLAIAGTTSSTGPFPVTPDPTIGGWLNPYDIASTPQSVLDKLRFHNHVEGKHEFSDARVIADGPVFRLPGGDVRVAVGAEWSKTTMRKQTTDQTGNGPHNLLPPVKAGVTSKSVFGEMVVPIFGADNGGPGFETLTLSVSGRYDDYGDGINTFNPKFAFTYEPFDWITFRGNWGKSFRAPNAADKVGAESLLVRCIGAQSGCTSAVMQVPGDVDTDEDIAGVQIAPCYSTSVATCSAGLFPRTSNAGASNAVYVNLGGVDPDLTPEKSTSWSIGADIRPPLVPGLTLSATYWNITFKDIISLPQPQVTLADLFRFLPEKYTICRQSTNVTPYPYAATNRCTAVRDSTNPYWVALQNFVAQANGGTEVLNNALTSGYDIVYFADTRITNLSTAKVSGIDASISYRTDVGFGSIDANLNGAWLLTSKLQFTDGAVFVDQLLEGDSRFRLSATLGATVGGFRAQGTYRHIDGFIADTATTRDPSQRHIGGADVLDLSFSYRFEGSDFLTKDLRLSLNINNVLDAKPIISKTSAGGTTGPLNTIGRLIQFGVSKEF